MAKIVLNIDGNVNAFRVTAGEMTRLLAYYSGVYTTTDPVTGQPVVPDRAQTAAKMTEAYVRGITDQAVSMERNEASRVAANSVATIVPAADIP